MRTIKFRAWNTESKVMLEWDDIKEPIIHHGEVVRTLSDVLTRQHPFIPLQYTGLTDKNGKEIYEGDIYQYIIKAEMNHRRFNFKRNSVVVWKDGAFWVGEYLLSEALEGDLYPEVIGNIYEHSHLL